MNDGWMIIMHDRFTKDTATIERLTARDAQWQAAAQKAYVALGIVEWGYESVCPACYRAAERGHVDDCELAAALAALRVVLGVDSGEKDKVS